MIAPASKVTPNAGRRQRQSVTPKPIRNGMLIRISNTGRPGWLLRGSGSPRKLNIAAVASRLRTGVPPVAPAGPTAIWLVRNSSWSGCWSQFSASGATTTTATIPARSRGAEERRSDGTMLGAVFPVSLSPCFPVSLSSCFLVPRFSTPMFPHRAPMRSPAAVARLDRCRAPDPP